MTHSNSSPTPGIARSGPCRAYLVDDHPIFRVGARRMIESEGDFKVCGEAVTAAAARAEIRLLRPDVVTVDIEMPGGSGLELVKQLRAEDPDLPILVLSVHDENDYAWRALEAGAGGYLMKRAAAEELLPALRRVLHGELSVSPAVREQLISNATEGEPRGPSSV